MLALHHRVLPGTPHFHRPHPRLDLVDSPFCIAAEPLPWDPEPGRHIAGVNALGRDGTHVHVIVEEPPVTPDTPGPGPRQHLFVWSAHSAEALDTHPMPAPPPLAGRGRVRAGRALTLWRAFGGGAQHAPPAGRARTAVRGGAPMLDEAARKHIALEYCRRINEGDVDGVLSLFTDPPHVEDPVGDKTFTDRAAYRSHLAGLVAYGVHETPGTPVAALDGEHVALPIVAELRPDQVTEGNSLRISLIALMRIDASGRIRHMRVFSGHTDMSLHTMPDTAPSRRLRDFGNS
ncbi:ketoacyl-synthetase C-terminal extension domain-containing protein [Streptomyces sp. NPDC054866]